MKSSLKTFLDFIDELKLKKTKRGWTLLCPFHQEKTPSFTIADGKYHCFGCQAKGEVDNITVNFIQDSNFKDITDDLRGDYEH